ncbi:hypothetical protein V5799_005004 [Amblyomma americanum]|uniref:Uncharacterized protein n=1 Tax=Amblyomma americanum TaxID=6943 RepID=A0AAQ4D4G8_AMBAM
MYNATHDDPAAYAQPYDQYGYDPALYAEAYGPYGYGPAVPTRGTDGKTLYGQVQLRQAPSQQGSPAFLSTTSAGSPTTWTTTEQQSNGGRNLPTVVLPMSVEVRVPASPAGDAPTTPSDASTTPKLRRADPEMLVCTYGRRTISDSVMASDGLCDIAFFDSIYAGNKNNLSGGSPFDSDLETFMRAATRYNRTTLGISFAFHHMYQLRDDLRRTNPNALEVFWRSRIYHTGILDTPTGATQTEMMTAMLRLKSYGPHGIRELERRRVPTAGLVSVTMKGRWTTPSPGRPLEFFERCERDPGATSFGSYTELCRVKNEVLDVNFGIAAYDVDYDDYANECRMMNKLGAHSRLKVLRKIVDYYRSLASRIFNETSCARVAS